MKVPWMAVQARLACGGNGMCIRSVEFWYDARTIGGRRAVVRLFGRR